MQRILKQSILVLTFFLVVALFSPMTYALDIYSPNPDNEIITCSDFDMVIRPTSPPMEGPDIIELQMLLREIDYYIGPINGIYNDLTEKSLKTFQKDSGINSDGWVTYKTWQTLTGNYDEITPVTNTKPTGSLHLVINKSERKIYLYDDGKLIKEYPVAVGKAETPTPVGEWKIASKGVWGGGFGTRWMGLNVPWGKFGIHGTNKPYSVGTYASHGCIRMLNKDVEDLYPLVPIGTPVIIEGDYPSLMYRTIKPGTASRDMLHVQKKLRELGVYWGPVDGRYGKMTEVSTTYFQLLNNLEDDGIINETYYKALKLRD
ncbi:MAG: hypothetical protein APF76_15735 [Desulfitibacter sp. BRH_c19]|nr:MAG: hypothetical protein APF76_15735 [Desulfitibacter sp. BRH_c19]